VRKKKEFFLIAATQAAKKKGKNGHGWQNYFGAPQR
jgi:hypothetical protein